MINVTCAIIRNEEDQVLVVQRGEHTDHPLKWEFPGGKVNDGESEEDCIIREIREELSIGIVICGRLPVVEHDYGHKQIRLIPFICDTLEELPFLSEHVDFKWIDPEELVEVDFSEADIHVAEYYSVKTEGRVKSEPDPIMQQEQSLRDDADLRNLVNNLMGIKEAEWVVASAIDNPEIFRKLMEYSFSDDKKLAFRASWTVSKVCDKAPELIAPHLVMLVESLKKIDNESVLRSFLRILSMTDMHRFGTKHHGMLADYCFSALRSGFTAIAIKAYAMEVLYRLALIYPELANELAATINMIQGEGSAGIVARGRQILKKLS